MDHDPGHDRGLAFDLSTMVERRGALKLLAGFGMAALAGCATKGTSSSSPTGAGSGSSASTTSTTAGSGTGGASSASCATIPGETAGPYPGDGSNGPNVLTESGIVRSDITSSFGSATGTASGIPLTIKLVVSDSGSGCSPLADAAVYLWHCDIDGKYSMYSQGITDQNYLRGVQETDSDGSVTFTSIFPAAYSGRWPHIHFEVYPSLGEATSAGDPLTTSQLALPPEPCELAYATSGYEQSVRNLAQSSLDTDNVFGDGSSQQLATVTGTVDAGFVAELVLGV
jgi:protocatechuate 3,4-dioxygenase beta subunit